MARNRDFQKSRFLDQENRYISTRATNLMHRARLKNLEKRVLSLEEDRQYLTAKMAHELSNIKAELEKVQYMVDNQGNKLRGVKGIFTRLQGFFGL